MSLAKSRAARTDAIAKRDELYTQLARLMHRWNMASRDKRITRAKRLRLEITDITGQIQAIEHAHNLAHRNGAEGIAH